MKAKSQPENNQKMVTRKGTVKKTINKQEISRRLNKAESNKSLKICNNENDINTQTTSNIKKPEQKMETNKILGNITNKEAETSKYLEKNKRTASSRKSRRDGNNFAEAKSCGKILIFSLQQKLIFNCEYCGLNYDDLENFARHLHEAHKAFNLDEGAGKKNAPRNLSKTNRIANNAPQTFGNFKREPLQPFDLLAEPPVVLLPDVLPKPLDSCGKVFMLNHRTLFLVCNHCECIHANLDLFEKHLRQQHRIFERCHNELNVVPKIEVKEEKDVIAEVVAKPKVITPPPMVAIPMEIFLNLMKTENDSKNESEIIATHLKKTVETSEEVKTEQPTSSAAIVAKTGGSNLNKELEIPVEVNKEISTIPINLVKSEISTLPKVESNEILLSKEASTRRPSTPVSLMPSPKRRQRNKRNNMKSDNEPTTTSRENHFPDKAAAISKAKKTDDTNKYSTLKSVKATITETTEIIETSKTEKSTESKRIIEMADNEKSNNEEQRKQSTLQEDKIIGKTAKVVESKKRPSLEAIIAKIKSRNATKSPQEHNIINGDLNEDPVNDIIEQLQIKMAEKKLKNGEETQKSLATGSLAFNGLFNEKNSTVNGRHQLLKLVKPFSCDVCPSTFDKRAQLIEHKRVHKGEKPLTCDKCGKKFRLHVRLNEHQLRHSKEENFKCEICRLGYCTKHDLKLHMRHHSNRPYQCTICPKAFVRNFDLTVHIRIHTGEKPFECEICHKRFRAKQNLSMHRKTHMGDTLKIYKCDYCEKAFMRMNNRKVHMRSHTGEKPYKCEICDRGYSSRANLLAHTNRNHTMAKSVHDIVPNDKRKRGPKSKTLNEKLEKQNKSTKEQMFTSANEMLQQHTLQQDSIAPAISLLAISSHNDDPIQNAYE